MASTPMDLDEPSVAPSLNITRTLGINVPNTSKVSEVIAAMRPTKVRSIDLVAPIFIC